MLPTIHSPGLGLSWQIWRRGRLLFLAVAGYFILLVLFQLFIPMGQRLDDDAILLALPLMPAFLYSAALMAYGDGDVGAQESCIPRHMLTLPASNWTLVLWPMLCSAVWAASIWILLTLILLRPCGHDLPLLWPAAMLAAVMATDHAAMIWPFGVRYARIVALLAAATGIIAVAGFHGSRDTNPHLIALYLGIVVVAYLAAVAGLTLARRGDGVTWRGIGLPAWVSPDLIRRRRTAFPRAFAAQAWFEFFRNSWIVTGQVLLLCVLFWGLVIHNSSNPKPLPFIYIDQVVQVNHFAFISAAMLFIPLLMAFFMGSLLGKSDAWSKQLTVLPFIGVRPISTTDIVAAKFRAAAGVALLCYAIVVPTVVAWAFLLRAPADEFFTSLFPAGVTLKGIAAIVLTLLLLIGATWKAQGASLWFTLSGRPWLVHGIPLGVMLIGGIGGPIVGGYIFRRPELLAAIARFFRENRGFLLGALVLMKLLLAAYALAALHRRELADGVRMARWIALWSAVVAALCAVTWWLVPAGRIRPLSILAAWVLLVPLARLALAPLMLNWNRHR